MIELVNLSKRYRGASAPAVDQVALTVPAGQLCVLIGPSGCGKTTTLKMVNRLIEPTSGRILINATDVTHMNPIDLRRSIGYAIQEVGLFPHMTVAQNVSLVPSLLKWPRERQRERVEELLELVRLDPGEYAAKYPRQLSGGQKQRVGVARALAADPPVLLMDEPFGAVDPITRDQLQNEFKAVQDRLKKTVMFVTHDINEALKLADIVVVMRGGQIVQAAPPRELLASPTDGFVADFVGCDRALKKLNLIRAAEVAAAAATLDPELPAREALAVLERHAQTWAYVVDRHGSVLGYANRGGLEKSPTVRQALHRGFTRVEAADSLSDALVKLLTSGTASACVVDEGGCLLGVINFSTIEQVLQSSWGA